MQNTSLEIATLEAMGWRWKRANYGMPFYEAGWYRGGEQLSGYGNIATLNSDAVAICLPWLQERADLTCSIYITLSQSVCKLQMMHKVHGMQHFFGDTLAEVLCITVLAIAELEKK